jgi:hypothetical protein
LREAKRCFAKDDFEGAMKTGVVVRKLRWIGEKDGREVVEYEINTALIEALNSVEKRAAVETGQEVDRSDIGVRFGLADQAAILNKPSPWMNSRRSRHASPRRGTART